MDYVAPPPGTCKSYPAVPGIPARPDTFRNEANVGWNSGANSVKELSGDLRLTFTQPQVQGAVVGITPTRENPGDYARITHGFLFGSDVAGRPVFRIAELGRSLTPFGVYNPGDVFTVERVGGGVTYRKNGAELLRSLVRSEGTVMAGCTLYSSGDSVESEETP